MMLVACLYTVSIANCSRELRVSFQCYLLLYVIQLNFFDNFVTVVHLIPFEILKQKMRFVWTCANLSLNCAVLMFAVEASTLSLVRLKIDTVVSLFFFVRPRHILGDAEKLISDLIL